MRKCGHCVNKLQQLYTNIKTIIKLRARDFYEVIGAMKKVKEYIHVKDRHFSECLSCITLNMSAALFPVVGNGIIERRLR